MNSTQSTPEDTRSLFLEAMATKAKKHDGLKRAFFWLLWPEADLPATFSPAGREKAGKGAL